MSSCGISGDLQQIPCRGGRKEFVSRAQGIYLFGAGKYSSEQGVPQLRLI